MEVNAIVVRMENDWRRNLVASPSGDKESERVRRRVETERERRCSGEENGRS